MSSRPSLRMAHLAVAATVGLSAVSCAGTSTSPTPPPASAAPSLPPEASSITRLLWPLAGSDGRDWVINNYVDLDSTSGTQDYTGATAGAAKTYNGHNGIDIDVPNFRWMDGDLSQVLATASGVVTVVRDTEPDRNTSCTGAANLVQVRHPDGVTAIYGHLKRGSARVTVGQEVSAGAVLGVVGSSGCSTAPHLHFELRDPSGGVVDPFRHGWWAAPPAYDTAVTLMDLVIAAGDMTLQLIKDPAPNAQSVPSGTVLGIGVSLAGGIAGDAIRMVITTPAGATFSEGPVTFTSAHRHSYWLWNRQLSSAPGAWTVSILVNGVLIRRETVTAT